MGQTPGACALHLLHSAPGPISAVTNVSLFSVAAQYVASRQPHFPVQHERTAVKSIIEGAELYDSCNVYITYTWQIQSVNYILLILALCAIPNPVHYTLHITYTRLLNSV